MFCPTYAEACWLVAVMPRSLTPCTGVTSVAESLAGLGSTSWCVTDAVSVRLEPGAACGLTSMVIVAVAPTSKSEATR